MPIYKMIDKQTGTVLENVSAHQIANILGVRATYVGKCAQHGNLIRNRYEIISMGYAEYTSKNIPVELWDEWDKICKPLNKVLRKLGKDIVITTVF